MTFSPKVLALDVDGTLVNDANELSPAVRDSVRAAVNAGMHAVISTGRSLPGVMDAVHKLDLTGGLAVASNGAVVFGYDPIEVIHTVTFDAREAVKLLLDHVPDAAVAVEEIGVGYRINKPFPDGEINGRMTVQTVDELVAEPVTRVIIRSPEKSAEEFAQMAHSLGLVGTNYFVGYTAWLDLAPEGVSKASGLEVVTERLGLSPADVLAIGDGHNDVEMLEWAGRGVAMGQAPVQVQDVADDVTETVDNDGAAMEIARYLG
ncbi:HAD family hydrolase [Solicola gregarius]|uniref:Cof-type HAD-IIB family hydrolase n=1 Tax=Solicola gregarius TaxID=2908642 RepID=A0AA46TM50_9ACTN|nr:HAD family hydrolase [Solicola gregarius]UYM07595.1 Cof-type HAD-IIB family hydrolase [Solicola gregarius]